MNRIPNTDKSQLTTFKRMSITERFNERWNIHERANHLSILTSSPHPLAALGYRTLQPSVGGSHVRPGYMKISAVYSMDWRAAEHFWGGKKPRVRKAAFCTADMEYILSNVRRLTEYRVPLAQAPATLLRPSSAAIPVHIGTSPRFPSSTAVTHGRVDSGVSLLPSPSDAPSPGFVAVPAYRRELAAAAPLKRDDERRPLLPRHNASSAPKREDCSGGSFSWLWSYLKPTRLGIIISFVLCL